MAANVLMRMESSGDLAMPVSIINQFDYCADHYQFPQGGKSPCEGAPTPSQQDPI
jgi:hypothetical protein